MAVISNLPGMPSTSLYEEKKKKKEKKEKAL